MAHEKAMKNILRIGQAEDILGRLIDARTGGLLESPVHLLMAYGPTHWQLPCLTALSSAMPRDEAFAQLTARNVFDETPLHRAAISNNAPLIEHLVEPIHERNHNHNRNDELRTTTATYNADFRLNIDVTDRFGRSPLWHAAAVGADQANERLAELGARVGLADD